MTNILAIDAATRLGWAYEVAGVCDSGVESFELRKSETRGWRYVRFHAWLYEWKSWHLDLLVVERPLPNHCQRAVAEIAFGFYTRIEEFCARKNVELQTVHNGTLKKYACGNGRASKPEMIAAAQRLKLGVVDDNESDALWLLEWARKNLSIQQEVHAMPQV